MTTMLTDTEAAKVEAILIEQLAVGREQLTPDAALMADLGADSLDMVEIGMSIEEAFDLTLPDEQMEDVRTVGDLHEALAGRLGRPV